MVLYGGTEIKMFFSVSRIGLSQAQYIDYICEALTLSPNRRNKYLTTLQKWKWDLVIFQDIHIFCQFPVVCLSFFYNTIACSLPFYLERKRCKRGVISFSIFIVTVMVILENCYASQCVKVIWKHYNKMEKKKKEKSFMLMMADLPAAEAWVFITVSVTGLLLHLPCYFTNKTWQALWKKIEKLKTGNIAQYNSWFWDTPDSAPAAKTRAWPVLSRTAVRYVILLKRTEGKEIKNILSKTMQESVPEFEMCFLSFESLGYLVVMLLRRASGMHPGWGSVHRHFVPCSSRLLRAWPSSPLPPVSVWAGRCGSLELKRRRKRHFFTFSV